MYNYKVTYRLNYHPLAPCGFYSYICAATTATQAKTIVRERVGLQLREKARVGLLKSIPQFSDMRASRIK